MGVCPAHVAVAMQRLCSGHACVAFSGVATVPVCVFACPCAEQHQLSFLVLRMVTGTRCLRRRARFRGYNTDLSKVPQFKRSPIDTGSTEVQVSCAPLVRQQRQKQLEAVSCCLCLYV